MCSSDLISAEADDTSSKSNGIHELQRLAASVNSPSQKPGFNAVSQSSISMGTTKSGYSIGTSTTVGVTGDLAHPNSIQVTQPQVIQSSLEVQGHIVAPPSIARRKPSRIRWIVIVLILSLTSSVTSLATRQPRPLYNYLHAHGWDRTLEMISKKVIEPALSQIRKLLGR